MLGIGTANDNDEEFEIVGETRKRKVNSVPAGISLRGLAMFQGKAILADGVSTSYLGDGSKVIMKLSVATLAIWTEIGIEHGLYLTKNG
jgi:hypothetical protein